MENFSDRLFRTVRDKNTRLVLGLDIDYRRLPGPVEREGPVDEACRGMKRFGETILDAVAPHCVAVKINAAFYERLGWRGWRVMEELAEEAKKQGLLVILDGKRGDIGSTSAAYAELLAAPYDALTLHPYMGREGLEPFVLACKASGKGLFVVVRSTNPGADELQEAHVEDGRRVCDVVGDWVLEMGRELVGEMGYSSVGAVVGVSSADTARGLRERLPSVPFLVPGFGAQGATAEDVAVCFDDRGLGAVVNASRSILYAYEHETHDDLAAAAARAAEHAKAQINDALHTAHMGVTER